MAKKKAGRKKAPKSVRKAKPSRRTVKKRPTTKKRPAKAAKKRPAVRKARKTAAARKKEARKVARKVAKKAAKKVRKAPAKSSRKPMPRRAATRKPTAKKLAKKLVKKPASKKAPVKKAGKAIRRLAPAAIKVPEPEPEPPPKKLRKTHLKKPALNKFREVLLRKRDLLVGDLQSLESQAFRASEQDSSANHMADFGSDNYEQDFNLGLIESDEEAIKEIDEALVRIDERDFGICRECGIEIPGARLEAIPWARLCVQCQALNEQF